MNRIYDENKFDIALAPQSAAGAVTGDFFPMKNHRTVGFPFTVGEMATGDTLAAQIVQATDGAGTGVKDVASATCTITADTNVAEATVTLASFTATNVIVINGLTFTGAAATDYSAREFAVGVSDTADAAELVLCINHATYGVPGITASSALGVVTLVATDPGETDITVVGVATIGEAATIKAIGYIEISTDILDTNNNFIYCAIKLTPSTTLLVSAGVVSDRSRYQNDQHLAAEYLNP